MTSRGAADGTTRACERLTKTWRETHRARWLLLGCLVCSVASLLFYTGRLPITAMPSKAPNYKLPRPMIHLVYVFCGKPMKTAGCSSRYNEAVTAIKSAILSSITSRYYLYIHVFVDPKVRPVLQLQKDEWPAWALTRVGIKIYNVRYPEKFQSWKPMFRTCATLRLFLQDLLPSVDALIYLDVDTLVLQPLDLLWEQFYNFNDEQLLSMVEINSTFNKKAMNLRKSFYHSENPHKNTGVNSGIILLNLTRIRQVPFLSNLTEYHKLLKDKHALLLGDQDLLNIYMYSNYRHFYPMPCNLHYTTDYCDKRTELCPAAADKGVTVLHGNRLVFCLRGKFNSVKVIHYALRSYNFGGSLVDTVRAITLDNKSDKCAKAMQKIHFKVKEYLNNTEHAINFMLRMPSAEVASKS